MINKLFQMFASVVGMSWVNTWWGKVIRIPALILIIPAHIVFLIIVLICMTICGIGNWLVGDWD